MDKRYMIWFMIGEKRVEGPHYSKDLAVETFLNCKSIIKNKDLNDTTVYLKRVE